MPLRAIVAVAFMLPLPMALSAQSAASSAPHDPAIFAFENFAAIFGSRLAAALDSIPAARYDYRRSAWTSNTAATTIRPPWT